MSAKAPVESNVDTGTSRPATHEACACQGVEHDLRAAGTRLLDETKSLRAELAKQAEKHPLAVFGLAFAAGLLVARTLRR